MLGTPLMMGLTKRYKPREEPLAGTNTATIPSYLHDNVIISNEATPKLRTP
jgi:hypothetical protein